MKTHHLLHLPFVCLFAFSSAYADSARKPDHITRNEDGSIKTRGVYETDGAGRVLKFTVFNGDGSLKYTQVPYYSPDGRLIRADQSGPSGELELVVVYVKDTAVVLDSNGKLVETQVVSRPDALVTQP